VVPCVAMTTTPALPPDAAVERLASPTRWASDHLALSVALAVSQSLVSCSWYPQPADRATIGLGS
jgi:hypothetical protein